MRCRGHAVPGANGGSEGHMMGVHGAAWGCMELDI